MRTTITIDDRLMETALRLSGFSTKKDVIEEGLKLLIQLSRQADLKKLKGKLKWPEF